MQSTAGNKLFWAEHAAFHYSELSGGEYKQHYERMRWFCCIRKHSEQRLWVDVQYTDLF